MTPRRVNILRNRTKLDANGPTETLHPNKPHVLRRESAEEEKKKEKGKAHQTLATMNSISRNNDGHQKGSLKCKIQRDRARCLRVCLLHTFHHNSPHQALPHPAGVRLAAATSLCLLCTVSRLNEPSVNFAVSQSVDQSQADLSCQPLAAFQLDFAFSFPPGRLLVSERPPTSRCEDVSPG